MPSNLTITGVCGWAIPPAWFERQVSHYFPNTRIRAIYPENPSDNQEASRLIQSNPSKLWIGYSLGSLWLMHHHQHLPPNTDLALLCPIPGFTQEMGMGGKTRAVQLNYLKKQLQKRPETLDPVARFFLDIELPLEELLDNYPIGNNSLVSGLDFLKKTKWEPNSKISSQLLIGEKDPLMDAKVLSDIFDNLIIVQGAGHHPGPLLARLSDTPIE